MPPNCVCPAPLGSDAKSAPPPRERRAEENAACRAVVDGERVHRRKSEEFAVRIVRRALRLYDGRISAVRGDAINSVVVVARVVGDSRRVARCRNGVDLAAADDAAGDTRRMDRRKVDDVGAVESHRRDRRCGCVRSRSGEHGRGTACLGAVSAAETIVTAASAVLAVRVERRGIDARAAARDARCVASVAAVSRCAVSRHTAVGRRVAAAVVARRRVADARRDCNQCDDRGPRERSRKAHSRRSP